MAEEGDLSRSLLDAGGVRHGLDQIAVLLSEVATAAERLLARLVSLRRRVDALAAPEAALADAVAERGGETQHSRPPSAPRSGRGGRPRKAINVDRATALRADGWSYRQIARELRVGETTLRSRMTPGNGS